MTNDSAKTPKVLFVPIEWSDGTMTNNPGQPEIPPALGVGLNAAISALLAGIQGMVNTARDNFDSVYQGDMAKVEYVGQVVKAGTEKATVGGTKAAAAFSLQEGMKLVTNKLGSEFLKKAVRSNAMTMIAFGIVDQTTDTYKYFNNQIDLRQYKIQSAANAGSAGGSIAGGAMGAVIGSAVPGLGTIMGGFIGSILGSSGAANAAKTFAEDYFPKEGGETEQDSSENQA